MFTLFVPAFPLWEYLRNFTLFMGLVMILSVVALLVYPSQRRKVALFWVAIGLSQVIFSGFYSYPYGVFVTFPNEVAFGLFILTSGFILAAVDVIKVKSESKRKLYSLGAFILGIWGLYEFINFASISPNTAIWNIWVNATPYLAFLSAAIIIIICGVLSLLYRRTKQQTTHQL